MDTDTKMNMTVDLEKKHQKRRRREPNAVDHLRSRFESRPRNGKVARLPQATRDLINQHR